MVRELHAIVSGRVQGVMYRDFAARAARRLGLRGSVRNLADGTVEVFAQGEYDTLVHFLAQLSRGSLFSKVEQIDCGFGAPQTARGVFGIVY